MHTCIHTYIHAYIYTCMHACIHTDIHTCTDIHIHTYIRTYIYIYIYIHTYICPNYKIINYEYIIIMLYLSWCSYMIISIIFYHINSFYCIIRISIYILQTHIMPYTSYHIIYTSYHIISYTCTYHYHITITVASTATVVMWSACTDLDRVDIVTVSRYFTGNFLSGGQQIGHCPPWILTTQKSPKFCMSRTAAAKCESPAIDFWIFLNPFCEISGATRRTERSTTMDLLIGKIPGPLNPAAYWKVHNLFQRSTFVKKSKISNTPPPLRFDINIPVSQFTTYPLYNSCYNMCIIMRWVVGVWARASGCGSIWGCVRVCACIGVCLRGL